MHRSSYDHMRLGIQERLGERWAEPLSVLDVGAAAVNVAFAGTYRDHCSPHWRYVGADVAAGRNVDVIMPGPYSLPFAAGEFDAVISGQCLEHVQNPFRLVAEIARVTRPGGLIILTAPWQWEIHRYPLDCWRILPDGMDALFEAAALERLASYLKENDCWGIAKKRSEP